MNIPAQYKFIVEDNLSMVDGQQFVPNRNLLSFLKYFLHQYKNDTPPDEYGGEGRERDFEMLGLLLWNYFFSMGLEPQSEKVKKVFEHAQKPKLKNAQFAVQFNEGGIIDYKLLPWELLCWPLENLQPEKRHCALFQNEKIRLIRVGKLIEEDVDFRLNKDEPLRFLFCVAGEPVPENAQTLYKPTLHEKLRYDELKTIRQSCAAIKSQLLVKLNGRPEEFYDTIPPENTPGDENKKKVFFERDHFDMLSLRNAIIKFKPHVIHLVTHGKCDGQGHLQMLFNEGEEKLQLEFQQNDEKFLNIIRELEEKPKLIYLQVCKSGQSSLPIALSEDEVISVIAMFYDIEQNIASKMAGNFYKYLLQNRDEVCEAFHQSRQICWEEMKNENQHFGLPIIYYNIDKEDQPLLTENHLIAERDPYDAELISQNFFNLYQMLNPVSGFPRQGNQPPRFQNAVDSEERYMPILKQTIGDTIQVYFQREISEKKIQEAIDLFTNKLAEKDFLQKKLREHYEQAMRKRASEVYSNDLSAASGSIQPNLK